MESLRRVRPSVDVLVERGNESGGEHLRAFPAGACFDPRLFRAADIACDDALMQLARARQGFADVLDQDAAIALYAVIERGSGGGSGPDGGKQSAKDPTAF